VHRSKQRIVFVCLNSVLFQIYVVVVILLWIFLLLPFLGSVLLLILSIRNIIILIIIKLLLFVERVTGAVQVHEVASGAIGLDHHYILLAGSSCGLPNGVGSTSLLVAIVTSSLGINTVMMTGVTVRVLVC
jgi:hypothetical protein